jgi:predicted tellurium resistance membrane protein TerC
MGRLPREKQLAARRVWMFAGIAMRILLLMALSWMIQQKGKPLFSALGKDFDLASLVMLGGGLFLLYKTVKEIHHKLEGSEEEDVPKKQGKSKAFAAAMVQIVLVDMVFSFDSIITAVGIAKHVQIMIVAVCIAMFIMFVFSQRIADFIHKHPTFKMLALSFLVMVGMVLIVEGWDSERAHEMQLKNYVYFAMAFSFGVEILNMRLRKKGKVVELHEPKEEDRK